jgi:ATP-dependent helicase/nuclease subunit A
MKPPHNPSLFEGPSDRDPIETGGLKTRTARASKTVVAMDDPYLVILASAGSGKTFQLTSRYLKLLRSGGPDKILASTFTRKAAHEIFDRVLIRLAAAVLRDAELKKLQEFAGSPPITREECISLLEVVTRQLHRVQIGTLDSLFSRLASSHTFELGFPPGWQPAEPVIVEQIKHRAIENVLRRAGRQDARRLMHLLAKGESTRRVHDLISETVGSFMQAYQLTSREAWERIPELPLLDPVSLANAILSLETLKLEDGRFQKAVDKCIEPITQGAWDEFLLETFPQKLLKGDTTYYSKELPAAVYAVIGPLVEHAKAWVRKTWADQTRGTWETLDRVAQEMIRLKAEERVFEFSDVTRRLAERLCDHESLDVGFRLDASPDHLLLDEFQDTSLEQWQILRPFAKSTTTKKGHSFFVVGDRKQAIYGWRGGEAAIFDTIREEFPVLQSQQLDVSRRSAPAVIEAVNEAFQSLRQTEAFETLSPVISEWCHAFPEHSTARTGLPGYVQLEVAADAESEGSPTSKVNKTEREEMVYQRTAERIAEAAQRTPSATIGVLFRKNAGIRQLAAKLRKLQIEFSEEGGTLVTDSAAVQLLISLLKIADHPGDRISRFHVSSSPLGEIHGLTDWESDSAAGTLSEHLRTRLLHDGYVACIQRWSQQLGGAISDHDRSRLRQLLELAESHRATTRVIDFVKLVESKRVENTSTARIQLMTVHKSKGLQFDIVYLPELTVELASTPKVLTAKSTETSAADRVLVYKTKHLREVLPEDLQVAYDQTRAREANEMLCLLYVAMTRAVHALHMILPYEKTSKTKENLAGVLLAGLGGGAQVAPNATLYETGDPQWYQSVTWPATSPARVDEGASAILPRVEFAPLEGGRRRGMERISPSQIAEKATKVKLASVLKLEDSAGADRGTLFHAWFERVSWLDDQRPDDAELRKIAAQLGAGDLNVDRCISQFQSLLRLPQVAAVLSKRTYQPPRSLPFSPLVQAELVDGPCEIDLDRERRFAVQVDGQMITGVIDRLVLLRRNWQVIAADILDFKTDAMPGERQETRDERQEPEISSFSQPSTLNPQPTAPDKAAAYRDQMRAYARAIGQIYRLPPGRVSTRLLMLATGRIEVVEAANSGR